MFSNVRLHPEPSEIFWNINRYTNGVMGLIVATTKRKRDALSAIFARTVIDAGTYSDGNGLDRRVEHYGSKHWIQRVTIDRKRRNLGLGGYPTVSLAEARKAALLNTRMIREGRDPLAEKREAIAARQRPPTPTFAEAAATVIEMRRQTWTN